MDVQNNQKTFKKMAINSPGLLIVTLNVNKLNAPTKTQRWLNAHKHKTQIYAVYKKPTSDLKIHID